MKIIQNTFFFISKIFMLCLERISIHHLFIRSLLIYSNYLKVSFFRGLEINDQPLDTFNIGIYVHYLKKIRNIDKSKVNMSRKSGVSKVVLEDRKGGKERKNFDRNTAKK